MAKIFISYRRDDTALATNVIQERLERCFGADSVFMDVDSIPIGVDFREYLSDAVGQCEVVLAMIGESWVHAIYEGGPDQGKRRLDDPDDFVRIEIESALKRGIPVVPVLVGRASMPRSEQLPAGLHALAYRNAAELRPGRDFRGDVERLITGLRRLVEHGARVEERAPSPVGDAPVAKPEGAQAPATASLTSREGLEGEADRRVAAPGEVVTNSLGMKLTLVPSGRFPMGSLSSDAYACKNEHPQHRVLLTEPFYLGVYPVTQQEYESVAGSNPSKFKGSLRPVENVSWFDAVRFCNVLSEDEDLPLYYAIEEETVTIVGGHGYRLPTEAEWEYACRAGTTTPWSFGNEPSDLDRYAWCRGSGNNTRPVGGKEPNAWGLFDMHGNVWNWCWDWLEDDYYQRSAAESPLGPSSGRRRVLRGGSFGDTARYVRSAVRYGVEPQCSDEFIGFRIARSTQGR